eukprot:TRINITY_DN11403_c0_g1_i3.p1 TRINITY_DN11403_c0_g1~~TRINITY_DN11403_c0_g1_i3.p1  ORF type:complete len:495 (-),score=116.38 TRINITY_DN11403_c0_g1_i3:226-1710(-)
MMIIIYNFFFFFQAEDGIRDLVRSRGLGDVYKRQISVCAGDPGRAYLPHGRTVEQVCGKTTMELIPHIPVLPISWGDAVAFMQSLGGSEAPHSFQGALNLTYRTGPSQLLADLRVGNTFVVGQVWNVIATVPGTLPTDQDQPVLLGNHRDAWVFGAADPNSGTAALLEVAKGLGVLLKGGWRPERSIVLCSWSGEEFGLLGSTAWGEVHGDNTEGAVSTTGLLARAAAYLNVDVGVSGTQFGASGTASLGSVLAGALGQVADPQSGRMLGESWEGEMTVLGSGSDYTVFIDHLGIPSLDMHFSPGSTYGVYHSVYDSFEWMVTEGDPGFHYHVTMSQLWGLVCLRLAGQSTSGSTTLLPLNITLQADAILHAIDEAKGLDLNKTVDFSSLDNAAHRFFQAAADTMHTAASATDLRAVNDKLGLVERQFLSEQGLPGRKWFRHFLQAPGLYTGYAPQNLPGVEHALQAGNSSEAQEQIGMAVDRIEAATSFLKAE